MMLFPIVAAIAFGPLGPVQTQHFSDTHVGAEVRYRIAHDREHDTGPVAAAPSIAAGTLILVSDGRTRTYDLGRIFPIHEAHIVLADNPPRDGCGVTQTLTRRGRYFVIEANLAQKGCAPLAAFIDLATGEIAQSVVLDHAWEHRFDAWPDSFAGRPLRVSRVERVTLSGASYETGAPKEVPWRFAVVRGADSGGKPRLIAFGIDKESVATASPAPIALPEVGSSVSVGPAPPHSRTVTYLPSEPLLRLDAGDERRYAARQTPTPPDVERLARRNAWFERADDEAQGAHFEAAVAAFTRMLSFEDNGELRPSEEAMLGRCRVLAAKIRAGTVTAAAASRLFTSKATRCARRSRRTPQ